MMVRHSLFVLVDDADTFSLAYLAKLAPSVEDTEPALGYFLFVWRVPECKPLQLVIENAVH